MNCKLLAAAAGLLTACLSAHGQQVTDSKTFMKAFRTERNVIVEVTNKYGNVTVTPSETDSVRVRVEVEASSDTESKLKGMISGVDIAITRSEGTVTAVTTLGKSVNSFFESFKGLTKSFINYETRLQINYYITCPPEARIRITNSYGDVFLPDRTADLTLTLSNGSLDAGAIDYAGQLNLSFCKAEIRNLHKGKISLSYGDLGCDQAGDLSLVIRATKTTIGRVGILDVDSKRDNLSIEEAATVRGNTFFSDITVRSLTKEAGLMMKYGNLSLESVTPGFSLLDLNTSYTDVDIDLEKEASYSLEIRHTNTFVTLPGITPEPEQTTINAESKIYLTSGKYGSEPDRSRIRAETTRGEIRIVQK